MTTTSSAEFLARVEQQFGALSVVLAQGDAAALAAASLGLQNLLTDWAQWLQASGAHLTEPAMRTRIGVLVKGMQVLRQELSRRAAYVDQALRVVLPTPAASTYAAPRSTYGTVVPQSGAFRVLAA
jgi:hypothetical protein